MNTNSGQTTSQLKTTFLVLRCQTGDEDAFHRLYGLYSDRTLRYLISVVGTDLAQDVHQEAWISVLRKIKSLDNPKRFKPWLYRIVRNAAIDHLRKEQKDDRLFDRPSSDLDILESLKDDSSEDYLDRDAIKRAISKLSSIHQEVVVLKYWEEFSYGEMALITGIPIGSIRSRLFHAKAHLKQLFNTEIQPF